MADEKHIVPRNDENKALREKIESLTKELESVYNTLREFELKIRSHILEEIIEEQELTALYKKIKRDKKLHRLEQKKKGKNYKEISGIKKVNINSEKSPNAQELAEKKKLYREAMFHVHPDKFSLDSENLDRSTEITQKLIEIYQTGSLQELQYFHAHIFSGNALIPVHENSQIQLKKDHYLKKEIEKLEAKIQEAKNRHLYKVITEYENPLTFIDELKEYYNDRLMKLRKRTRKARK